MLKNGRPYSIENGWEDARLLTDENDAVIVVVSEWIRANIRKSGKILKGRTSYGIKHILQHDTGVYLTNNQFKDAMLTAGFAPVDPNELNWRYRICLTREINSNPSPFFRWAVKNAADIAGPEGDFVDDMVRDFTFPVFADHDVIVRYLHRCNACKSAIEAFETLWSAYERENR